MGKLMDLFGRDDVDLVVLNRATPVMAHQVATRGRVLYEAREGARAGFQVSALHRYEDTRRLRRIQTESLLERVEQYRCLTEDSSMVDRDSGAQDASSGGLYI